MMLQKLNHDIAASSGVVASVAVNAPQQLRFSREANTSTRESYIKDRRTYNSRYQDTLARYKS